MPRRGSPATVRARKRKLRARSSLLWRRFAVVAALLALSGAVLGLAFAGSPTRLASGVRIAGVDVGGMSPGAAKALLERKAKTLAAVPVVFRAGGRTWELQPRLLGVRADWGAAVDSTRRQGRGFGPFRGFRRLDLRFFGADVAPPTQIYDAALRNALDRIEQAVNTPHREASIVLRRMGPEVVPARTGHVLDRAAAAGTIVRALAALRREPVGLPIMVDPPKVQAGDLAVAVAEVKTALSAPLQVTLGPTDWRFRPSKIAKLLRLPAEGRRELRVGGPGADRLFAALARRVDRAPVDADFAVSSSGIRVIPDHPGVSLDVPKSAKAVLRALLVSDPALRTARLAVERQAADVTTAEAHAMRITGLVASYQTVYGGEANRIHNVQLVAHLVDKHLIAPGATFSFNETTGARTADKGFLVAPVIINGELKTGLGGGVCQVSTTVFNAAYEAGLPITSRTNHALYISHYPQGRDATVNYPDTDLKFVNDTGHWLLLRTWVGSSSLTVALYGTPSHRRVVSETGPLVASAEIPVKATPDPALSKGERIVEELGQPARTTSVRRKVYDAHGKLLYDATFYSSYRAEPSLVLVGTKPTPKPKPGTGKPKRPKTPTTTTQTTTTTTTQTTTTAPQP